MIEWKNKLFQFEKEKNWESAISLMEKVLVDNPRDLDAFLSMNYMLMNLLVEENYERDRHDYYAKLLKKSYDQSFKLFSGNSEYLFYMGIISHMSEWYFDIDIETAKIMILTAAKHNPENALYNWGQITFSDMSNPELSEQRKKYAHLVLEDEILVQNIISKGSLGKYILELISGSG